MKTASLRELTPAELQRRLDEALRELQGLTLRRARGRGDARIRETRRQVARLRTVLGEKSGGNR